MLEEIILEDELNDSNISVESNIIKTIK